MNNSEIIAKLEADHAVCLERRDWNARRVNDKDTGGLGNYHGEPIKASLAAGYYNQDGICLENAITALKIMGYDAK